MAQSIIRLVNVEVKLEALYVEGIQDIRRYHSNVPFADNTNSLQIYAYPNTGRQRRQ
jgi:hypothetical protein